jgi:hypothetical protein
MLRLARPAGKDPPWLLSETRALAHEASRARMADRHIAPAFKPKVTPTLCTTAASASGRQEGAARPFDVILTARLQRTSCNSNQIDCARGVRLPTHEVVCRSPRRYVESCSERPREPGHSHLLASQWWRSRTRDGPPFASCPRPVCPAACRTVPCFAVDTPLVGTERHGGSVVIARCASTRCLHW